MQRSAGERREPTKRVALIVFCVFVAAATLLLWTEHRAHVLGALPYLLFLLCPAMHFLMHRGHDHSGSGDRRAVAEGDDRSG